MISARDLLAQCCGVIVNGCNHPNTQMTVQRLELNLRSRHGGKDVRSGKSSTPAPRSSPPLTRLLTAILAHVTGLTWDLHAAWSASSGDCLNNVEAITQQQYDMAELYGIIPVMVAALTELDEGCKLAIATAASATGKLQLGGDVQQASQARPSSLYCHANKCLSMHMAVPLAASSTYVTCAACLEQHQVESRRSLVCTTPFICY